MFGKVLMLIGIFVLGFFASTIYASIAPENPVNIENPLVGSKDRISPFDRISEDKINVYKDRIVLDIQNEQWSYFAATRSMDHVLDAGTNAIQLVPQTEEDIHVGDIVSYESEYSDGIIIHRVVYKGEDEQGTFFVLKGDNNPASDTGRVRFDQIQRVVVALIY